MTLDISLDMQRNLPQFVNADPQTIVDEMVAAWELATGKTLYPAQVERLLINTMAYRESLLLARVNAAAAQNLVRFASGPMLDYLGEGVGAPRLAVQYASVVLEFSVDAPARSPVQILAGTLAHSDDGAVAFATEATVWIPSGARSVTVSAYCTAGGALGNLYQVGSIATLMDFAELAVVNVAVSAGGVDAESDAAYRERLLLAPAGFSVAGPEDAYVFLTRSAHQSICSCVVTTPAGAEVDVYFLTAQGAPDQLMIDRVKAKLSDKKVRPLSDRVRVLAAPVVAYAIVANLTLYAGAVAETVLALARAALDELLFRPGGEGILPGHELRQGVDVVPLQIAAALRVAGVYDVVLASLPAPIDVPAHAWAHCTEISLNIAGVQGG